MSEGEGGGMGVRSSETAGAKSTGSIKQTNRQPGEGGHSKCRWQAEALRAQRSKRRPPKSSSAACHQGRKLARVHFPPRSSASRCVRSWSGADTLAAGILAPAACGREMPVSSPCSSATWQGWGDGCA